MGKRVSFHDGFTTGNWITSDHNSLSNFAKAVVATTAWYIWKARCNAIFKNEEPNFINISRKAYALAQEYFVAAKHYHSKSLILSNFLSADAPFLFSVAFCSGDLNFGVAGFYITNANHVVSLAGCCGAGFYITDANHVISLAGCCPISVTSTLDAELNALLLSMQCALIASKKIIFL